MVECKWVVEGVKVDCHCPNRYARCRLWVRWDEERGDYTRGHGGWGWRDPEAAKAARAGTDLNACAGGVCTTIDNLCSRHQSQYQAKYGRASNE